MIADEGETGYSSMRGRDVPQARAVAVRLQGADGTAVGPLWGSRIPRRPPVVSHAACTRPSRGSRQPGQVDQSDKCSQRHTSPTSGSCSVDVRTKPVFMSTLVEALTPASVCAITIATPSRVA